MKEIKIVVAGGRNFNLVNYNLVMKPVLTKLVQRLKKMGYYNPVIVSGKAPGADTFGEKFAEDNNLKIDEFPADWNRLGKAAGPIRNEKMAKHGDMVLVFWDGKSPGSRNMISQAEKYKKKLKVFKY